MHGINTILIPVKDLAASRELYRTLLGIEPHADAPYYVGFNIDGQEIGLNPSGHADGMTGPVGFVDVPDLAAAAAALMALGATMDQAAKDVGGGMLVASLRDADGNPIGLRQLP
jgi:catechol 2,3-dioxygenase-like lactoylglutathione lyase family enzyme